MNRYVSLALIICLLTLAASGAWVTHRFDVTTRKTEELTATAQRAMTSVADLTEFQTAEFRSDAYQKRVKQGFEVGRDASITIAKFNRLVIPEIVGVLRDVRQNNLPAFHTATDDFAELTRATSESLNGSNGVLPNLAALAATFNTRTNELLEAAIQAVNEGRITAEQFRKLFEDPNVPALIAEMKQTMANLNETTAKVAKGFAEFPDLMTLWRKYSETANKWQKRIYLARILGIIVGLL